LGNITSSVALKLVGKETTCGGVLSTTILTEAVAVFSFMSRIVYEKESFP